MENFKIKEKFGLLKNISAANHELVFMRNDEGKLEFRKTRLIIGAIVVKVKDYVATTESDYADQLDNFALKLALAEYQSQYGYDDDFKNEAAADAAYNRYTYTKRNSVKQYEKSWTAKKDEVRHGKGTTVTAFATGADVSSPPPEVLPGNEDRFRAKAQWLKDQTTKTTDAAEKDFGISTKHSDVETGEAKPDLTHELVAGGHPKIFYTKGIYQGIELEVDRGDGNGFVHLAEPGNPSYTDNGTLPAPGQAKVWSYRAIYHLNDERVGDWCDPMSVTVKG